MSTISSCGDSFILFPRCFGTPLVTGFGRLKRTRDVHNLTRCARRIHSHFVGLTVDCGVGVVANDVPCMGRSKKLCGINFLMQHSNSCRVCRGMRIAPSRVGD